MAKTLRLMFDHASEADKVVTVSVAHCDEELTGTDVKSAMDAIYANRDAFGLEIGALNSAAFVTPMSLTPVTLPE